MEPKVIIKDALSILSGKFLEYIRTGKLQEAYEKEADAFMTEYNKNNTSLINRVKTKKPKPRAVYGWDSKKGTYVKSSIIPIRFRRPKPLPGESKTFTFYGTMFVKGSKYSKQFILSALCDPMVFGPSQNVLTSKTVARWKYALQHYSRDIIIEEGLTAASEEMIPKAMMDYLPSAMTTKCWNFFQKYESFPLEKTSYR